jgi:hypothetical protein
MKENDQHTIFESDDVCEVVHCHFELDYRLTTYIINGGVLSVSWLVGMV